jgi:hypothetical protein
MKSNPLAALDRSVNVAQLFTLIGGLWWLGSEVGRRDFQLSSTVGRVEELASIVQDLAKAQIANATADAGAQRELDLLRGRIERLESNNRN